MEKNILVAGATGNLGLMICKALVSQGAKVTALVRNQSDAQKLTPLTQIGANVIEVDFNNTSEIQNACQGVHCVVSALAGLADVIIDTQKQLLDGAVAAGVNRVIPSDFCTDYQPLTAGKNRNFDLRRAFREYIDSKGIQATSIFNGAFADILKYNTPILNLKNKSIAYWGEKADWKLDFTTMENTAAFTASVALQDESPRDLHIASFQISPKILKEKVKKINEQDFTMQKLSELDEFSTNIKKQREENPSGEQELYAKWQQAQYMYSMYTTQHTKLDNQKFGEIEWTSAEKYLKSFLK
ncbi:SDR family NAD(P)-dependent oxidoreductase [Pedobacter fastidiosus]|uniref:SDR family NAD(P)-dependent oxidoreductase n=1 Tax=Pedobacter fastidiosus TaxID=2765361 RepID=A0ABR7KXH3_9SPHI|nr:SDR family NAD(P)-dependent oxidoreductase [Pedobacter fastidiosus]MBC6112708.1 SDR family NAD(P)-dependent oxidoreductase [Pedobacter fastidiosus]